ncbi:hypothetical protein [Gimesia sp.]|uniref:hypothetical protein n=1 Tax=Gimesia sp. TaxID=2024833 RepID=UPI003A8E3072
MPSLFREEQRFHEARSEADLIDPKSNEQDRKFVRSGHDGDMFQVNKVSYAFCMLGMFV